MRHTLAHYRGAVMMRLVSPNSIDPAALDLEINNACEELGARVRDMREAWLDQESWIPLRSNLDIYPLPAACRALIRLERWIDDTDKPVQMRRIDQNSEEILGTQWTTNVYGTGSIYLYQALPNNRIRLLSAPSADRERGLRATYTAKVVPLIEPDSALPITDEVHEWVVWAVLDRVRQYGGVQLANPEDCERTRLEQNMRLLRFLRPMNHDDPATWGDEDEL